MKVFISHSSQDNKFVRTLKEDLAENGILTWVDLDTIRPGDNLIDKLETALGEMTHFLIVLSPNSVESEWVNYELEIAINNQEVAFHKVIPLVYRECKIPQTLQGFVRTDLSQEVVRIDGERIKFIGDTYHKKLQLLVEAIRKKDIEFTDSDKVAIKNNIEKEYSATLQSKENTFTYIKARYRLVGYKTKTGYKTFLNRKVSEALGIVEESARPVLLPAMLSLILGEIKIGETIEFDYGGFAKSTGHFAGFRKDDLKIVLPIETRKPLGIKNLRTYIVEVDVKNRRIAILDG